MVSLSLNQALITNTALLDASAVVDDKRGRRPFSEREIEYSASRIFSLLGLCEAVCLLDQAYVLVTATRGSGNLISALRSAEIVTDFVPNYTREELRRYYGAMPLDIKALLGAKVSGRFWKDYYSNFPIFPVDYTPSSLPELESPVNPFHLWWTLISATRMMSGGPDLRPRDHILRGNAYLVISNIERMDYFPDAYRSPYVQAFLGTLYRSLSVTLYDRVASALKEAISISDDNVWPLSVDLPIPPVGALVLDKAESPRDIPDALMQVRSDFAQYRRHFSDFKEALRMAETFKDRRRLVNSYRRLLAIAAGNGSESVTATEVLDMGGAALKTAIAPTSPVSYSDFIKSLPLDKLRIWWQKRPVSIVYRLDSKLPRIDEYNSLVGKHWGDGMANEFSKLAVCRAALTRDLLDLPRSNDRITARQLRRLQG